MHSDQLIAVWPRDRRERPHLQHVHTVTTAGATHRVHSDVPGEHYRCRDCTLTGPTHGHGPQHWHDNGGAR